MQSLSRIISFFTTTTLLFNTANGSSNTIAEISEPICDPHTYTPKTTTALALRPSLDCNHLGVSGATPAGLIANIGSPNIVIAESHDLAEKQSKPCISWLMCQLRPWHPATKLYVEGHDGAYTSADLEVALYYNYSNFNLFDTIEGWDHQESLEKSQTIRDRLVSGDLSAEEKTSYIAKVEQTYKDILNLYLYFQELIKQNPKFTISQLSAHIDSVIAEIIESGKHNKKSSSDDSNTIDPSKMAFDAAIILHNWRQNGKTYAEIFSKKTLMTGAPVTAFLSTQTTNQAKPTEDAAEYLDFPLIEELFNNAVGPGSDLFTNRQRNLEASLEAALTSASTTIHRMGVGHYTQFSEQQKTRLTIFSTNGKKNSNTIKRDYVSN